MQDAYETIPEEYTEIREIKHYPKLPSISTVAEYDVANDNHEMAKDADQLLRIMANPELFRRSEDEKSKPGSRQGTRDSITTLVSGMFRIAGSVSVSDNRKDNDLSEQKDKSEHGNKTIKRSLSLPQFAYTGENQRMKKLSAPPSYTINITPRGNKQGFQTKIRKPPSSAGFYTLPDIMED